jgi:aminopeptidase N
MLQRSPGTGRLDSSQTPCKSARCVGNSRFIFATWRLCVSQNRRAPILLLALAVLLLAACSPVAPPWLQTRPGTIGAAGLGDSLYPTLGNDGYDVIHYDLALDIAAELDELAGVATIAAVAAQPLTQFNLDLAGLTVDTVIVDDAPAAFTRAGHELTITPATPLPAGERFTTTVAYHGAPQPIMDPAVGFSRIGWQQEDDTIYVINEPSGAMTWFPSNNHPLDKATFTYRITAPEPQVVAANGVLAEEVDNGATRTYVWEMRDPMATYLAALYVGDFEIVTASGPDGEPIRYYFPPDLDAGRRRAFARVPEMMAFYRELLGAPYPFDSYGGVVVPLQLGYAMENQTMNLFGLDSANEFTVAHELMHEWFGNHVTLGDWQDIWLNEGFAYYLPLMWAESLGVLDADALALSQWRMLDARGSVGPATVPQDDLFGESVYVRGGLTLHALRQTVGDEPFAAILREYYRRHAGSNATTADFVAVANDVSGQDLTAFFDAWLYQEELPPLPGA